MTDSHDSRPGVTSGRHSEPPGLSRNPQWAPRGAARGSVCKITSDKTAAGILADTARSLAPRPVPRAQAKNGWPVPALG